MKIFSKNRRKNFTGKENVENLRFSCFLGYKDVSELLASVVPNRTRIHVVVSDSEHRQRQQQQLRKHASFAADVNGLFALL